MAIVSAVGVAVTGKRDKKSNRPKDSFAIEEALLKKGRELIEEGVDNPKLVRRRMAQARREAKRKFAEEMNE